MLVLEDFFLRSATLFWRTLLGVKLIAELLQRVMQLRQSGVASRDLILLFIRNVTPHCAGGFAGIEAGSPDNAPERHQWLVAAQYSLDERITRRIFGDKRVDISRQPRNV